MVSPDSVASGGSGAGVSLVAFAVGVGDEDGVAAGAAGVGSDDRVAFSDGVGATVWSTSETALISAGAFGFGPPGTANGSDGSLSAPNHVGPMVARTT